MERMYGRAVVDLKMRKMGFILPKLRMNMG
jgi:hypothetical protein